MTIHIGIDYTAAMHQSAGIGRYTRELVRSVAALSPAHQYHLFVADGRRFDPARPGPNFRWHPTRLSERWLARLWYRLRLPLPVEWWTGPLDLFHQPDFVLPPVKANVPTLLTVHDLSFIREPSSVMPGMIRHLTDWVPRSVERADHIVAVSEATRRDLIELYQTPPEKISVIYHGVTAHFKPVEQTETGPVRQKYGLGDRPFMLSVGTIQPRKNYRRLIRALARLDPSLGLVIVGGKGWGVEEILAEAERQNVADRVYFPGFVPDEALSLLYNAAALFVYPSLYEGFGLPLLEAMACGRPVAASNQSALPEVVGEAGLLFDPHNVAEMAATIDRLWRDAPLRRRLSQAARQRAARFTWEEAARRLLALYKNMLER